MLQKLTKTLIIICLPLMAVLYIPEFVNQLDEWEVTNRGIHLLSKKAFYLTVSFFFSVLSVRAFVVKKYLWMKILLGCLYAFFLVLFIQLTKENLPKKIIIVTITLVIWGVFSFLKDRKWKKYVFVFHVGIISLITLIVGLFVIKDPKSFDDKIDENVLFISLDSDKKIIEDYVDILFSIQKELKTFLVSNKVWIFRKKIRYGGKLPDGKWKAIKNNGDLDSEIIVRDGKIITEEVLVEDNSVIVNTIDDVYQNLNKSDFTFLFKDEISFALPIKIKDCSNVIFNSLNKGEKAKINFESGAGFELNNTSNIVIKSLQFNSKRSPFILSINHSNSVNVKSCEFSGDADTFIQVDKASKSITIGQNQLHGIKEIGIKASRESIFFEDNIFYTDHRRLGNAIEIEGVDYTSIPANDIFKNVLAAQFLNCYNLEDHYDAIANNHFDAIDHSECDEDSVLCSSSSLNDIWFPYELDAHFKVDEVFKFATEQIYKTGMSAQYPLSYNVIRKLFKTEIVLKEPASNDLWCLDEEGKWKFKFINPAFVNFLYGEIDFQPDNIINGVTYQTIYNKFLALLFRKYYCAYKQIYNADNVDEMINSYKELVNTNPESEKIQNHIFQKYWKNGVWEVLYSKVQATEVEEEDHQIMEVDLWDTKVKLHGFSIKADDIAGITGVWVRRIMDGSAESLFNALDNYMTLFDKEWKEEVDAKYRAYVDLRRMKANLY